MEYRLKLLVRLNRTDREYRDFESLNEMTSVRGCLSDLSKTAVTLYQSAVLFSYNRVDSKF